MPAKRTTGKSSSSNPALESNWIELYHATVPALYRLLSRRTGAQRELTEDLTQEAWLRLLRAHAGAPPPDDPLAWLVTTATNLMRNHFRRSEPVPLGDRALDLDSPEEVVDNPLSAALVQWGLARLKPSQAALIESHYFDARSLTDIARERGLSARAVEGRLRRARKVLERLLAPHIDGALS